MDADPGPTRGRGRYDRRLTRAERALRQRARLVHAARRALDEAPDEPVTVSRIVGASRSGRNTFYEHFDDAEQVVSEVVRASATAIADAMEVAVSRARTPVERVRALAAAWVDAIVGEGRVGLVATERASATELARIDRAVRGVVDEAHAAGALRHGADDLRAAAALGAMKGVARAAVAQPRHRARAAEVLADALLGAFR